MARRFAVGDIHGCSRTFRALVEDVIHVQPGDRLYLLGDYIDRGPDSAAVLDMILDLQEKGVLVHPIMGNHERMFLDALERPEAVSLWLFNGGTATLASFAVHTPRDIPERYRAFIASLPPIVVTDDYVFVHAGLDFHRKDPISETSEAEMLWGRDFEADASLVGGRTLVVGHTVTGSEEIAASLSTGCIRIDNGCFTKGSRTSGFGSLVALDLDARELLLQRNCD